MGEHFFEAFLAGGVVSGVIAARGAGGGGDLADGDEAVVGEAGEDGVEGGFGEGEAVACGEALEELIAVGLSCWRRAARTRSSTRPLRSWETQARSGFSGAGGILPRDAVYLVHRNA